jgi:hypothetical protein
MNKGFRSLIETKNYFNSINEDKEVNITRLSIATCPYCTSLQSIGTGVNTVTHIKTTEKNELEVNRTCTNPNCARSFVDFYEIIDTPKTISVNKVFTLKDYAFETEDFVLFFTKKGEQDVFGRFHGLYAEAIEAMKSGMEEASGMLLRKALEALIIDYIRFGARIKNSPIKDSRTLENQGLMKCVEMVEDVALKELAKRAVWIGNDNVHTKKKWNHFDSDDLNRLLGAIVLNIYAKIECLIYLRKMNKR